MSRVRAVSFKSSQGSYKLQLQPRSSPQNTPPNGGLPGGAPPGGHPTPPPPSPLPPGPPPNPPPPPSPPPRAASSTIRWRLARKRSATWCTASRPTTSSRFTCSSRQQQAGGRGPGGAGGGEGRCVPHVPCQHLGCCSHTHGHTAVEEGPTAHHPTPPPPTPHSRSPDLAQSEPLQTPGARSAAARPACGWARCSGRSKLEQQMSGAAAEGRAAGRQAAPSRQPVVLHAINGASERARAHHSRPLSSGQSKSAVMRQISRYRPSASRRVVSTRSGLSSSRRRYVVLSCAAGSARSRCGWLAAGAGHVAGGNPCPAVSQAGLQAVGGGRQRRSAGSRAAAAAAHQVLLDQRIDVRCAGAVGDALAAQRPLESQQRNAWQASDHSSQRHALKLSWWGG